MLIIAAEIRHTMTYQRPGRASFSAPYYQRRQMNAWLTSGSSGVTWRAFAAHDEHTHEPAHERRHHAFSGAGAMLPPASRGGRAAAPIATHILLGALMQRRDAHK